MINAAHPPTQFVRRKKAEGGAAPAVRGDFVKRAQENTGRAAFAEAMGYRTHFPVAMPPTLRVEGIDEFDLRQKPAELLADFWRILRPQVRGQRQLQAGGQQVFGDEAQPAQMMTFGARLVEQEMLAGRHGADLFCSSQSLAYFRNV